MHDWFLLLPLLSSVVYVVGAMALKLGARYRVNFWYATYLTNMAFAVCALPLWWGTSPDPLDWSLVWQPLTTGLCGMAGQVLTIVALQRGDVSIATPVLGLKVLFVALFTTLLSGSVLGPTLWGAALLSSLGIALLQFRTGVHHHHVLRTIAHSGASAVCYALHDALVFLWKPNWNDWFLPITYTWLAVCSGAMWFRASRVTPAVPREARGPIRLGAFLIGAQGLLLIFTIAAFGEPTRVNLVYNARGMWSVLAVWAIGHWFDNDERGLDRATLLRRLCGALLMLAAIGLAVSG
ncbi:MAG: DMT family transporter [Pirellulales bacterium]